MDTNEIRHITQMAYLSWPDHGVPESDEEFVDFVEKVRTCRQGYSLCPTVVHCSAGRLCSHMHLYISIKYDAFKRNKLRHLDISDYIKTFSIS